MGKNPNELQKSADRIKQILQRMQEDRFAYKALHLLALLLALPLSFMAISCDLLQKLFVKLMGFNDLAPKRVKFLNGAFKALFYLSGAVVLLALQPAAMVKALLKNLNDKLTFPASKPGVRGEERITVIERLKNEGVEGPGDLRQDPSSVFSQSGDKLPDDKNKSFGVN